MPGSREHETYACDTSKHKLIYSIFWEMVGMEQNVGLRCS